MKTTLDSFEIDPNNPNDVNFTLWYAGNKQYTKQMVMMGYHVLKDGFNAYNLHDATEVAKDIENIKKRHADELIQEKVKYSKIIQDMKDTFNPDEIKKNVEQEFINKQTMVLLQKEREYSEIINQLKDQIVELRSNNQLIALQTLKENENKYSEGILELSNQLSKYKALYTELKNNYENAMMLEKNKKIQELSDILQTKENEMNVLKKTTHAKGNKGENLILSILKDKFAKYEFFDTSKEKHSGDLHMISKNGDILMLESKYKESITKQDLDKFYGDIVHLKDTQKRITCGVFVSLLTKNIPHIGEFKIDFCKGVPILLIGFSDEDEFKDWFHQYIEIALELSNYYQNSQLGQDHIKDIIKKISPLVDQIKSLKISIEKLRSVHLAQINNMVIDMENNIKKMFDTICEVISSDVHFEGDDKFKCEHCGSVFNSKRSLASHIKVHKI